MVLINFSFLFCRSSMIASTWIHTVDLKSFAFTWKFSCSSIVRVMFQAYAKRRLVPDWAIAPRLPYRKKIFSSIIFLYYFCRTIVRWVMFHAYAKGELYRIRTISFPCLTEKNSHSTFPVCLSAFQCLPWPFSPFRPIEKALLSVQPGINFRISTSSLFN